jgi:hypothetical protein
MEFVDKYQSLKLLLILHAALSVTPTTHGLVDCTALDYPPFFAYFEFLLSLPARLIDKRIVELSNLNYGEWSVVAYQRTTVIITELVLGAALLRYVALHNNLS